MAERGDRSDRGDRGDREDREFKPYYRRKVCRFCTDKVPVIDYKDLQTLRGYISDRGKIMPRRISGVCAAHQRELNTAIKRARNIALVPFTVAVFTYLPDSHLVTFSSPKEFQEKNIRRPLPYPASLRVEKPEVKGIHVTSWIAGDRRYFPDLIKLIDETELNTVVIDLKEGDGRIAYDADVPLARSSRSIEKRIRNLDKIQDYNISLAEDAARRGFDEIQFDYVRFPSDGPLKDISYPEGHNEEM